MRKFIVTFSLVLLVSFGAAQNADILTLTPSVGSKFTCSRVSTSGFTPLVVKAIGDVNGDLVSDIAVGIPDLGMVAIIYGGANLPNGLDVCTFSDLAVGFRIRGAAPGGSGAFGATIAIVGDLNGDGIQDIAVADTKYGVTGSTLLGRVYVIYTPAVIARRAEMELASLSYYSLTGSIASQGLGTYIADGIDYNGDGLKDVLISSSGSDTKVYILFGRSAGSEDYITTNLNILTGAIISHSTSDTSFGRLPVASCADLNQDGFPDYVIMGNTNLFIFYGLGMKTSISSVPLTPYNGLTIPLGGLSFSTSNSVTCADMDMDGIQDVIVSLSDQNVHVLYGSQLRTMPTTSIAAKTTQLGFLISQNVASSTFGKVLKRTDGWSGYGQDTLLIADPSNSQVYAVYATSVYFGKAQIANFAIDSMIISAQGFKVYTKDTSFSLGSSLDATYDINGDGLKDLLVAEGVAYNSYAYYGQCQSSTGCACPVNMKYKNGYCVSQGLSGGQKVGIIVGVIIGAMLLIALGVLILKKTSCGANCFESYSKPVQFGTHSHTPIPQTMATSA